MVLPLDITAPTAELHGAAVAADNAFDGAGVDYLVHNAGQSRRPFLPTIACIHCGESSGHKEPAEVAEGRHPWGAFCAAAAVSLWTVRSSYCYIGLCTQPLYHV